MLQARIICGAPSARRTCTNLADTKNENKSAAKCVHRNVCAVLRNSTIPPLLRTQTLAAGFAVCVCDCMNVFICMYVCVCGGAAVHCGQFVPAELDIKRKLFACLCCCCWWCLNALVLMAGQTWDTHTNTTAMMTTIRDSGGGRHGDRTASESCRIAYTRAHATHTHTGTPNKRHGNTHTRVTTAAATDTTGDATNTVGLTRTNDLDDVPKHPKG